MPPVGGRDASTRIRGDGKVFAIEIGPQSYPEALIGSTAVARRSLLPHVFCAPLLLWLLHWLCLLCEEDGDRHLAAVVYAMVVARPSEKTDLKLSST